METEYPGIPDRLKAIFTDGIVLFIMILFITSIFARFNHVPDGARIFAFVFTFLLYDPLMTSLFGGTVGHFVQGIRVKREQDETRNIYFHMALIRFVLKTTLGWLSFLTMAGSEKSLAIHDLAAGSVVLYKKSRQ
jgi:uncharacterized RDD family membrane protein YckC